MKEEFKTNWDELQEAYSKMAYLRLKICEKTGELQKLQNELTKNRKQIYSIGNKIIKENEKADKI